LYYYRKNVVDLYVSKRESRTPFFLYALASYGVAAALFFATGTKIILLLALAYTVVTAILMVVNMFWKVSIHCAGVTGPIFALIFVFGTNVLPLSLIIGLLCWSRVKLRNHTFSQTAIGTLIALTVGLVEYTLLYP
jgi:membrane-associated phospholipid phosphatase